MSFSAVRTFKFALSAGLVLLLVSTPVAAKSSKTSSKAASKSHSAASKSPQKTSHSKLGVKKVSSKSSKKKKKKGSWRTRGQQNIDSNRAREIQAALIQAHYLDGEPTGTWDARSKAAMEKYQADNGWQTKKIPDARALIKLGLGPDHSDLINPNTASIATPDTVKGGGVPNNPQ